MATQIVCDRCGENATHEINVIPLAPPPQPKPIGHYDLCWGCKSALDVFLRGSSLEAAPPPDLSESLE